MKNKFKLLGVITIAMVIVVLMATCDANSTNEDIGGTFTLTDIPSEYTGRNVEILEVYNYPQNVDIAFADSKQYALYSGNSRLPVSNGKVSTYTWQRGSGSVKGYSGNHFIDLRIQIFSGYINDGSHIDLFYNSIPFINGNAAISFNDDRKFLGNFPSSHTPLHSNQWTDGNFTNNINEIWYSFAVLGGTKYNIWLNDAGTEYIGPNNYQPAGDGSKTLDVDINYIYADRVMGLDDILNWHSAWAKPISFTPSSDDTLYIRIRRPVSTSGSGTFAVVYNSDNDTNPVRP